MDRKAQRWVWAVIVLFGAVCYGILSPVIKMAYRDGFNGLQVTLAQLIGGCVLLWGMVLLRARAWSNPFREPWIKLALLGWIGIIMTSLFINAALLHLPAALSVVMLFQFTWITLLLEWLLNRKRPTPTQLVSVVIVVVGTILAAGFSFEALEDVSWLGLLFGLCSAVTYSTFLVFAGRVGPHMDPVLKSAVMMTPGLPLGCLCLWLLYPGEPLVHGDMAALIGWALLLGVLAHAVPVLCFNIGIPKIGSSLAAMIGSAELPAAVIAAGLMLNERIGGLQWTGIVMIVVSILVSERKQQAS